MNHCPCHLHKFCLSEYKESRRHPRPDYGLKKKKRENGSDAVMTCIKWPPSTESLH